ncbi:hypothetical protein ACOI1H_08130 [Loktanella sp. DJP18]|uniref:hypothetical protein n=1 Tax=Loktanella sp. DJP18 TaxID=3409788 RepID=UPI003BB780AF
MPRFDDYLAEVQQRMNLNPIMMLVRAWTPQEITAVENAIRVAVVASGIIGLQIPNFTGTNQAKGNKAANHFLNTVSPHLARPNSIVLATGSGYPDRIFRLGGICFCMEMKATSNWRNADGNRRVLTSSPTKMRNLIINRQLASPPAHLICTVLYNEANSTVTGIRLDFLEPNSEIKIRLEASTTQQLLHNGAQTTAIIP